MVNNLQLIIVDNHMFPTIIYKTKPSFLGVAKYVRKVQRIFSGFLLAGAP